MTDCLFCRIARGEMSADLVYEDDDAIAFRDINPQAPVHVLVIPRKHVPGLKEAGDEDEILLGKLLRITARVADQEGVLDSGFRTIINSGADAQQSVPHLHVHVLGGRAMTWPPG